VEVRETPEGKAETSEKVELRWVMNKGKCRRKM